MARRHTQSELERPGHCTTCGAWSDLRNTAGQCMDCHNRQVFAWREEQRARREAGKAKGLAFWQAKGIQPGDRVERFAVSWFGIGGELVQGMAKVGANGAYVTAPTHPGRLAPHGWQKPTERRERRREEWR